MSDAGAVAMPSEAPAAVPRLQTLTEGRTFEWTVVLLSCLFAAAGYFDIFVQ